MRIASRSIVLKRRVMRIVVGPYRMNDRGVAVESRARIRMQYMCGVANRGHEVRRADVLRLAIVRRAAEARQAKWIVAHAGQGMRRIGCLRIGRRRRAEAAGKP